MASRDELFLFRFLRGRRMDDVKLKS